MTPRPPDPDFEKPLEDFQGQLEHDAQNYMRAIKPVLDRGGDYLAVLAALRKALWDEMWENHP
jgi:hypothetical protein